MTEAVLDKAIALRKQMSDCADVIRHLDSGEYTYYVIKGICDDGVSDFIDQVPIDCVEAIKQWYTDRFSKLQAEFKSL